MSGLLNEAQQRHLLSHVVTVADCWVFLCLSLAGRGHTGAVPVADLLHQLHFSVHWYMCVGTLHQ